VRGERGRIEVVTQIDGKPTLARPRIPERFGGGRGIRTPETLSGPVVFKTVQGWEGHQPLPISPNKNGPILQMSLVLIGACPHQDTDKKRTVPLSRN
jgi:hypothetical protein